MIESRPLITFGLFAYRQEKFVRQAIQGAFAQTYSPLEIIISDDCSPDDTFKVICEEAKKYSGPHRVKVQQTERNLGVGSHVNHVMGQAKGEIFILAAGDDISLPQRTETIWREWERMGRKPTSIHSAYTLIDEHEREYGEFTVEPFTCDDLLENIRRGLHVVGCTHAVHKSVFQAFGPLREDLSFEDCAIALRSRLLGGIHFIPEPLVRYRRAEGAITFHTTSGNPADSRRREFLLQARRMLALCQQWEDDFRIAGNAPAGWEETLRVARMKYQFTIDMVQRSAVGRLLSFVKGLRDGLPPRELCKTYAMFASRLAFSLWVRLNPRMRSSSWEHLMNTKKKKT